MNSLPTLLDVVSKRVAEVVHLPIPAEFSRIQLRACVAMLCLLPPTTATAVELKDVQAMLDFPLLDAQVPQAEVERYCGQRVPRMPKLTSLDQWEQHVAKWRANMFERCIFRGEAVAWRDAPVEVVWLDEIGGGPGYRIRSLRYQVLPGLWVPALLYEPMELRGKVPVVMNVNGHDRNDGKAARYKQLRCINMAKRGILALNVEWLGMGQLNTPGFGHYRMNQLDLCGTSGIAPFYLSMQRGLDVLLSHEHADPQRVAVAGLSGGGWQTIFISALDTRVSLTNPVAGYSSFLTRIDHHSDLGDSEQTPCDMAIAADYKHLTAMMAPRATLLTFNVADQCCFASGHALQPLVDAAEPAFQLYQQRDRLATHVNHDPGSHNFKRDNREALYRMLGRHFFAANESFDPREIDSDDELKSKDELTVPLPEVNADFNQLATRLATDLPRHRLPAEPNAAWQETARERLRALIGYDTYVVKAGELPVFSVGSLTARFWKLRLGDDWTVPAVELTSGDELPRSTTIVVSQQGRSASGEAVAALLREGHRVIAVDPFYIGESKIPSRDFLFALLVGAVGKRPVGIQTSQLAAVVRWAKRRYAQSPLRMVAVGERMSLAALMATGIEPTVEQLELHGALPTLHDVIARNIGFNEAPEFFCFGLLEAFDIRELAALAVPREVHCAAAGERMKTELAPLKVWYAAQGKEFSPVR